MKQTFIVTIDSDEVIKSREVADALNMTTGIFSLTDNHDDIIIAKARKIYKKSSTKYENNSRNK